MRKPTKLTIVVYNDDGSHRVTEKIKQPAPKREADKRRKPRKRSA